MIDVLYYPDDITVMYSMYPLLKGKYQGEFHFTDNPNKLERTKNNTVLLFRMYKRRQEGIDLIQFIERLHGRGKRVAYFDDTADPREIQVDMLEACDVYFKKQILRDVSGYLRPVYGKRMITEYFNSNYGIEDENPDWAPLVPTDLVGKIHLSWNLGIGVYPKTRFRRLLAMRLSAIGAITACSLFFNDPHSYAWSPQKQLKASALFGSNFTRNTVSFHRRRFIEEMAKRPELFITGKLPLREYNIVMKTAIAAVSPFGWGEICFRDFEALINRSVLLKPDMSHIRTWPDVYRANETYIPLHWGGEDLVEKTQFVMDMGKERFAYPQNAISIYEEAYRHMDDRVRFLIETLVK